MKIRMCPYCDHEMERKHRCSVCMRLCLEKAWEQEAAHDMAHHQVPEAGKLHLQKTMVKIAAVVIAAALLTLGGIQLKREFTGSEYVHFSIFDDDTDILGR